MTVLKPYPGQGREEELKAPQARQEEFERRRRSGGSVAGAVAVSSQALWRQRRRRCGGIVAGAWAVSSQALGPLYKNVKKSLVSSSCHSGEGGRVERIRSHFRSHFRRHFGC